MTVQTRNANVLLRDRHASSRIDKITAIRYCVLFPIFLSFPFSPACLSTTTLPDDVLLSRPVSQRSQFPQFCRFCICSSILWVSQPCAAPLLGCGLIRTVQSRRPQWASHLASQQHDPACPSPHIGASGVFYGMYPVLFRLSSTSLKIISGFTASGICFYGTIRP